MPMTARMANKNSTTQCIAALKDARGAEGLPIDWGFRNWRFSGVTNSFLESVVKLDEVTNSFLTFRNCQRR